jgi:hypothetical protein
MAWCFVRSNANHPWPKNTASPVHQGQAPSGFNWDTIVDTIRDEQVKDASGLCKPMFDTTVLVAASVAGHPHQAQALSTLLAVHNKTVAGCVGGRGLSERYAVLTRAPVTPPIYPLEAWKIIFANVLRNFEIITRRECIAIR